MDLWMGDWLKGKLTDDEGTRFERKESERSLTFSRLAPGLRVGNIGRVVWLEKMKWSWRSKQGGHAARKKKKIRELTLSSVVGSLLWSWTGLVDSASELFWSVRVFYVRVELSVLLRRREGGRRMLRQNFERKRSGKVDSPDWWRCKQRCHHRRLHTEPGCRRVHLKEVKERKSKRVSRESRCRESILFLLYLQVK